MKATFPSIDVIYLLFIIVFFDTDNKEVVVEVLGWFAVSHDVIVLAEDAHFSEQGKLRLPIDDKVEGVTHDCNKHVHEDDVREKCAECEE